MKLEPDADWWIQEGLAYKWVYCHSKEAMEACEQCAMCNADNVELQLEAFDQVLICKYPNGEMHLIEWRCSYVHR
jgi:hypothetical protein